MSDKMGSQAARCL